MIKLIKPYITLDKVASGLEEIFANGVFTKGKNVRLFSEALIEYTGAKHAFLTTSATTALALCLEIVGVTAGDEVVVSDFSFPATANVVENIGAKPIFIDVNLESFNMQLEQLEKKITPRTKAIIFVDAFGNPSGLHAIKQITTKHNLPLIEDAACAIGSSESGIKCGAIADLTCFSFHPRKLLTTGEGGAILTNNDSYAETLAIKLNHGSIFTNNKFDFVDTGYNYRMPEISALMGLTQLGYIDDIIASRTQLHNAYKSELEPLGFRSQYRSMDVVHNLQSLVFIVPEAIDRDTLILQLREKQVESTLGTYALSSGTYYKNKYNDVQYYSKYLQENTITLPAYEGLDIMDVTNAVKQCLEVALA